MDEGDISVSGILCSDKKQLYADINQFILIILHTTSPEYHL